MTTESKSPEKEETLTDEELTQLANFGPAITDELVYQLEESASAKCRGIQRRLVLLACSRSVDVLSDISVKEPEAFKEMLECIEAFKEHAKGLAEMAESAYVRMLIADCREAAQQP
jgi:hypothetical protein